MIDELLTVPKIEWEPPLIIAFRFELLVDDEILLCDAIESDIRSSVEKYIPNLLINRLTVEPLNPEDEADDNAFTSNTPTSPVYRYPGKGTAEYTAKIKIEYSVQDSAFATSDFVIINI